MKISQKQVQHLAFLARLKLDNQALTKFQKQLGEILSYINRLNQLDTRQTEPTAQTTELVNVTRQDKVQPSQALSQAQVLLNAPDQQNNQFRVKKVL